MNAEINIYNPDTLGAPLGQYCHVTRVKATEFLFIAGSLAADKEGNIIGPDLDFEAQCTQVLEILRKRSALRMLVGQTSYNSPRTS